jgi:hypothetical protein
MEAPIDTSLVLDRGLVARALVEAVTAAGGPSIHNIQAWHWRERGGVADLYAESRRQLTIADPDRRLLTLSRGRRPPPRLHRSQGHDDPCLQLPAVTGKDRLAAITVTERRSVTQTTTRFFQTIQAGHTDRRPLLDKATPQASVEAPQHHRSSRTNSTTRPPAPNSLQRCC